MTFSIHREGLWPTRGVGPLIGRGLLHGIEEALEQDRCALLVGPYEVGKSTLAREIAARFRGRAHCLNGRDAQDREKLSGEGGLVRNSAGKLIVIDEIQGFTDGLDLIHGEIERARHDQREIGRFLVLGSSSIEVARLVALKLGTRARAFRLSPIGFSEVLDQSEVGAGEARAPFDGEIDATSPILHSNAAISLEALWLRGGFPKSLLAHSDETSFAWREQYLGALSARGCATLPAPTVRNFLERVASLQGEALGLYKIPAEQRPCLAHFEDLGLIRQLRPWLSNEGKRLEKEHKVYIRDSGLLHCLLRRRSHDELRTGGKIYEHSWKGFCIENLIAAAGTRVSPFFYRSEAGYEADLVLEFPGGVRWVIEIKGPSAKVTKGFDVAATAMGAVYRFGSSWIRVGSSEAS